MKAARSLKRGIFLIVILALSFSVYLHTSLAQPIEEPPKVSLKMFIVPEKEACPPGYKDYDSGQASNCPILTIDDIEEWERQGVTTLIKVCPPSPPGSVISLGKELMEILDSYRQADCNNRDERKSLVIVFTWDIPQNSRVSLRRQASGKIPSMPWSGVLPDHKNWIHHERADAFLPANNISWILTVGKDKWEFKTER